MQFTKSDLIFIGDLLNEVISTFLNDPQVIKSESRPYSRRTESQLRQAAVKVCNRRLRARSDSFDSQKFRDQLITEKPTVQISSSEDSGDHLLEVLFKVTKGVIPTPADLEAKVNAYLESRS